MAERIATGSRPRVLEKGPDTWHSDDEAKDDVLPDVEKGMYTEGMDPEKGPIKLSQHEAGRQRAAASALKAQSLRGSSEDDDPDGSDMVWSNSLQNFRKNTAKVLSDSEAGNSIKMIYSGSSPEPTRQPTPLTTPVNSDDEEMSVDQRRKATTAKKLASRSVPRSGSAQDLKPPARKATASKGEDKSATRSMAVAEPSPPGPAVGTTKAAAPPKAPADPKKGQKSPGTNVPAPVPDPHPMVGQHALASRRARASTAGSSRSWGGSGSTDTCVDSFNPSKT
jgi:hypothetical protein